MNVPDGTVVKSPDGELLADLIGLGTEYVAAEGGHGGLGNAALASTKRKAPGFALRGEPGQQADLLLELKTIADVGLVGFPNAGKSSLISAMSAARPKIANYPFTTLIPHLGVIEAGDTQFVMADVPGLIPGASEGRGLGLEFLRHVERCSVLVHVIDCATEEPGRDPITDLDVLESELTAYDELTGADMASRPRIVVLNKIDVPEARDLAELVLPDLAERDLAVTRSRPPLAKGCATWGSRWRRWWSRPAAPHPRRANQSRNQASPGGRSRLRTRAHGSELVPHQRGQAAPVDSPNRLQQRRGRGLPCRSAGQARGRRSPGAGRRRARRRGHDRRAR